MSSLEFQDKGVDSVVAQSEKGSSSLQHIISTTLNRKMKQRSKNGGNTNLEPVLHTECNRTKDYDHMYFDTCVTEMKTLGWLSIIIEVIGLAGNAAVIWFLGFQMCRNAISVYILNLAMADFLYLCFQFVDSLNELTTYSFMGKEIYLSTVMYFVFEYFYIVSLSFLSAISLERCLSVLCPIWYRCHRPEHTSSFMCVIVWVLSLLHPFLLAYYCSGCQGHDWNWCWLFKLCTAGYLLLLFVILSGSSLALTVRMFCGSRRMPMTRLYVTVLITVLFFIFFGLPYGIVYLLISVVYKEINKICYLFFLLLLLSSVNSCANPIIYFFVGSFWQRQWQRQRQRQRQTLKGIFQRALQDTPEDNECGGSLSQGTLEMSGSRVEQ